MNVGWQSIQRDIQFSDCLASFLNLLPQPCLICIASASAFSSSLAILLECQGVDDQQVWLLKVRKNLRDGFVSQRLAAHSNQIASLGKKKTCTLDEIPMLYLDLNIWWILSGGEGCRCGWQPGCELPCTARLVGFLFCVLAIQSTQVLSTRGVALLGHCKQDILIQKGRVNVSSDELKGSGCLYTNIFNVGGPS